MTTPPGPSFTGFQRKRTSSRSVLLGDRVARWCITFGGLATILAVALVCVFLVWVVVPLFLPARLDAAGKVATPAGSSHVLRQIVDPYLQFVVQVRADGNAAMIALADGALIAQQPVFDPAHGTCLGVQRASSNQHLAHVARDDGSLLPVQLTRQSAFVREGDLPPALAALRDGAGMRHEGGWFERTDAGGRQHTLAVEPLPPIPLGDAPVRRLDVAIGSSGETLLALDANGRLWLQSVTRRENMMTLELETKTSGSNRLLSELGIDRAATNDPPDHLLLAGSGDSVLLVWNDGDTVRLDARDVEAPVVVERFDLLPDPAARVTALEFLLGDTTLLVGDDTGVVHSFFRSRPPAPRGRDGSQFDLARDFGRGPAAVLSLSASERTRDFLVAYEDGSMRLVNATTAAVLTTARAALRGTLQFATLAPKEDAVVAASDEELQRFRLDPGHPEVTLAAVFLPVRYEGAPTAEHVWQTTGGTDEFEPKFGLWPLAFGTLKATLYCLLFGVPLALLAAIYTSEFLHPRTRLRVKPVVELMASLPSVVLGFLAALVFAPVLERHLVTMLATLVTLPLVWLLGAQLIQLPTPRRRLWFEGRRLWFALLAIPVAILLASWLGAGFEALFFGGDFKQWLATDESTATAADSVGGWLLVTFPIGALLAAIWLGRSRWFLGHPLGGLLRLGLGALATAAIGLVLGYGLAFAGLELRGTIIDTYVQRNALVVGIVMGFAVIPIVYTIAEDALSAVPEHLRAASLGAGATPWQTATRIILPTAMSGIFSAIMVGLGRAVGETMIVLMATGGTPILDLNVFNGFETLSQAIAIEMPEAVRGSTHYRMLYLAALLLFAFTFVLNTVAEVVRQRFRRRAWQL